jgi:cardiolipin synthase A/B
MHTPNESRMRRSIEDVYGLPFSDGNRVRLLWRTDEMFPRIFRMIQEAEEMICLEFYIFRDDDTGRELAEILKRKASEGVKVYVIYDHFGSFGSHRGFFRRLKESGVRMRAARPFKWTRPFHYVHRNHKKVIVVDGVKAFTGGLNIANEYSGFYSRKKVKAWRDAGIFMEGPVAASLMEMFRETWKIWEGEEMPSAGSPQSFSDGVPAVTIFASSSRARRKMRKLLYSSITTAGVNIYLTTAYFTPSRRMLQVLEEAVIRGVDVKLILPGKSDIAPAHYAGRAFFTQLLRAGVEIYSYKGEMLHAKAYIFDDIWSIIGSANLDFQSLRKNDEGNIGVVSLSFGKEMLGLFEENLKESDRITLEQWLERPFVEKVKEKFFSLFRRRL